MIDNALAAIRARVDKMAFAVECHRMSDYFFGMARDCVERARLGTGNPAWVLDELMLLQKYRSKAKEWRARAQ